MGHLNSEQFHRDDTLSVKLWVDQIMNQDLDSIIWNKNIGVEDGDLGKSDFCLAFATSFQREQLKLYGGDKICMDGTHGLNAYGFQLYTLMVLDGQGNGVLAVFCFSNRQDQHFFQLFFAKLKEKVGTISAKVFMSDDYPAFYNTWDRVMGEVKHRLLCSWHINRNWSKNLGKVKDVKKRELINTKLKIIRNETDRDNFLKMWTNLKPLNFPFGGESPPKNHLKERKDCKKLKIDL